MKTNKIIEIIGRILGMVIAIPFFLLFLIWFPWMLPILILAGILKLLGVWQTPTNEGTPPGHKYPTGLCALFGAFEISTPKPLPPPR